MEVDPNSLDPELRTAKFLSLASASLGLMSLCLAIIPACGGIISLLGIIFGLSSMKAENSKTALAGVIISALGLLVTIVYALFLGFFQQ
jgi:fumarate reductase subunit D